MGVPVHGHGNNNEHCGTACEVATEFAKLRERVRFHAINIEPFDSSRGEQTWIGCAECYCAWPEGEPEDHGDDCLASPTPAAPKAKR